MVNSVDDLCALAGLSSDRARALTNRHFSCERFKELYLGPGDPPTSTVAVSECSFVSCQVDGPFAIADGVHLQSVTFSDVRAPDGMTLSSASIYDNVVINGGRKAAGLWCKPPSHGDMKDTAIEWAREGMAAVDVAIDFSGLAAPEFEVVGIPTSKLRWHPELHIRVSTSWEKSEHWDALKLSERGAWRFNLRRLRQFKCDEGVFSLPVRGDRHYLADMEELARIESAGLLRR